MRLFPAVIALGALVALGTAGTVSSARSAAANRCTPTVTTATVAYHCWGAYPEAFYTAGFTRSAYRINWTVSCGGQSVSGSKKVRGVYTMIVNQFTSQPAYQLMIKSDVCKFDVVATRTAGSGSITIALTINVNHPLPAHN